MRETFSCEVTGKCNQFVAVPGCGLRCDVSHIDNMVKQVSESENFNNYSTATKYISQKSFLKNLENRFVTVFIPNSFLMFSFSSLKNGAGDDNFNVLLNNVDINVVNLTAEQYQVPETELLVNTSDKSEENNAVQVMQC